MKKYRFYVERPLYRKCYEEVVVEAETEAEALELCKDENIWGSSDIGEWEYDIDSIGEPEIVNREEIQE